MKVDLTGNNYNGLLVTGLSHKRGNKTYWSVVCSCGNVRQPLRKDSLEKHTGKCTCDLTGKTIGKLFVLSYDGRRDNQSFWKVQCDCGKVYISRLDCLRRNTEGCGAHIRPYEINGGIIKVDVSTSTHPNTFTYVVQTSMLNT